MIGTPEELEGLSCCVGTIFGPLPKETPRTHFTSIEPRRQVGDSHHNPARFAGREDSTMIFLVGHPRRSVTSSRTIDPRGRSHRNARRTPRDRENPMISRREMRCPTRSGGGGGGGEKNKQKRVLASARRNSRSASGGWADLSDSARAKILRRVNTKVALLSRERDSTVDDGPVGRDPACRYPSGRRRNNLLHLNR